MAFSPDLPDGLSMPKKSKPKSRSAPRSRPAPRAQPRNIPSPAPRSPSAPPSYNPGPVQSVSSPSPKPKPRPKPPSLKQYLSSDEVYQQALRGGNRSLQDFLSELNRRRGESKTSFNQTKEQMEVDRTRQLDQMRDEFASRGLIHSGLYAKEQGTFQEQFQTQMTQAQQAFTSLLADLKGQGTGAKREQELAKELARQEAIARRASRFGLGL